MIVKVWLRVKQSFRDQVERCNQARHGNWLWIIWWHNLSFAFEELEVIFFFVKGRAMILRIRVFHFIHQPGSSGKCLIDKIICMGEEVRVCYVVTVSFCLTCFSGFSLQISSKGQPEKKKSKNKNFVRFSQSCIWFNVLKLNSVNCSTYHTAILSKLVKQYLNNNIIWRDNVFLCAFFLTL